MKLQKLQSTNLKLKPCSMTSFSSNKNETLYAIACYEQDSAQNYIGEIIIANSKDLSEEKRISANGGVFRIYSLPEENSVFAVTTSGDFMFIDAEIFETRIISHPDRPYFTDGSVSSSLLASTDDKGNVHVLDRQTGKPLTSQRAHKLRQVGDLECPAFACSWINESTLVSGGDDGRLCLWDYREGSLHQISNIRGISDDGIVFTEHKSENVIAVGDYAQNYYLLDLRSTDKKPFKVAEFPGGVWHIDSSLEASHGLSAAAVMQGGVIVFDSRNLQILAHDSNSSLTYGTAIHECSDSEKSLIVAEIEFDARKLNRYLLVKE